MMAELQSALSAKGLLVSSISGKGRALVATGDFSPGDVVICEEPYASAPNKVPGGSSCDGCFATSSLKKCSACWIACYCGNMCQKSEWKVHQLECKALAGLSEVSISYIETAATTDTRQKDLKQYFFSCTCSRCIKDLQEDTVLDRFRCRAKRCNGFLFHDSEKTFTCQQCGLARDQQEIESIASEAEEISKRASALLSSGNYHDASVVYNTLEHLQLKLCHSFSIKLLRTRETLLKIMMELNDWSRALSYCRLTIPVYQRVYPKIHPMLGLQYYTCGKLEWLLEYTGDDALRSFTKAIEILHITRGTDSPFTRELSSKVNEAQAEADLEHIFISQ